MTALFLPYFRALYIFFFNSCAGQRYIVACTQVLIMYQMYHTGIHTLHCSSLSPSLHMMFLSPNALMHMERSLGVTDGKLCHPFLHYSLLKVTILINVSFLLLSWLFWGYSRNRLFLLILPYSPSHSLNCQYCVLFYFSFFSFSVRNEQHYTWPHCAQKQHENSLRITLISDGKVCRGKWFYIFSSQVNRIHALTSGSIFI
jgi:hypothetical protein